MECFIKCTSSVSFKLDFFSCSSPVSRWPQKTCIPKKKFKVRELPCCSWLFKISLRVPAPYPDEDWCHITFQNTPLNGTNRKGKFIKMVTFLFVDSECWITETEGGEKNNLSRLTLLVASSAQKLEIASLESVTTELSSFKRVCRNCKKERNKVRKINK